MLTWIFVSYCIAQKVFHIIHSLRDMVYIITFFNSTIRLLFQNSYYYIDFFILDTVIMVISPI